MEGVEGDSEEEDLADTDDDGMSVNMVIIEKKLQKGITGVAVTIIDDKTSDERAKFKTVHHYSQFQEDKVYLERTSWAHRVWGGITKQTKKDGPWTTVLNYDKLANGDPHEFTNHDAYKYDIRVRRRRSSHYTYSFTE